VIEYLLSLAWIIRHPAPIEINKRGRTGKEHEVAQSTKILKDSGVLPI